MSAETNEDACKHPKSNVSGLPDQPCLPRDLAGLNINVRNITTCFNVKTRLNLKKLARTGYNTEHKYFNSEMLTMKLRKPNATAIIWPSGKVICTRTVTEHNARMAARRIARIIQRLDNPNVIFGSYKIVNVFGCCTLPFAIQLVPFAQKYKSNVIYEPELNVGVIYKITELQATLTIFSSGTITVYVKSVEMVKEAIHYIYPLIYPFRKNR
ncbi:TATA box-binding protein-like 1 [Adelges cooleyi]|uniref:TATA box-binding protein-like 1 n=1 Tax=Adelges cooleyi TaxID=133065 RepID=UPI00217F8605|nr:TATA box-binding protein-like 1 [Adelges cooleyi]